MKVLEIFTDGACRGNPGPAAVGIVIKENGKVIKRISKSIWEATNNIAEYTAFIYALKEAAALKAQQLKICTDSELLYYQLTGTYQIKNENLKALFEEAKVLGKKFKHVEIKRIPREQNQDADKLATQAIKKEQTKVVASVFHTGEGSPSSAG